VYCAAKGARAITGLDSSERALALAARHHEINGSTVAEDYRKADVPQALRAFRDARQTFDMIILDPPRFVYHRAQLDKALRAYKDINLLAVKLLSPGGILATFSCSGLVTIADFKKVVGWASADAARNVRILETLGQPADHPILAVFRERVLEGTDLSRGMRKRWYNRGRWQLELERQQLPGDTPPSPANEAGVQDVLSGLLKRLGIDERVWLRELESAWASVVGPPWPPTRGPDGIRTGI